MIGEIYNITRTRSRIEYILSFGYMARLYMVSKSIGTWFKAYELTKYVDLEVLGYGAQSFSLPAIPISYHYQSRWPKTLVHEEWVSQWMNRMSAEPRLSASLSVSLIKVLLKFFTCPYKLVSHWIPVIYELVTPIHMSGQHPSAAHCAIRFCARNLRRNPIRLG